MSLPSAIAVVGPSGVGKDTVMQAMLRALPGLYLVRRVVTRAPDAGGEDITAVDEARFHEMVAAGEFALHWGAHGLFYGIPAQQPGDLVPVMNLSRSVLGAAQAAFPGLTVISLTAAPEVLAARLALRGREPGAEQAARLRRASAALPQGLTRVHQIDNSGDLSQTMAAIQAALLPVRA